jgi:hypothetical protein
LKKKISNSITLFILFALLAAALGAFFVNRATHWGPWAFSDSAAYVSASRNFKQGLGFVIINSNSSLTPVTEFPPFYPIFLSYFLGGNGDINVVLGNVCLALLVIFICVYGYMLFRVTNNALLALLGMLVCATSPILMGFFTSVMSETLFFPLLYAVMLLAILYVHDNRITTFIALLVLSSLLPITRYAGALFATVTACMLVILPRQSFNQRLQRALLYLGASLLPVGVWFLKLYLQSNKVGGKSLAINFNLFGKLLTSFGAEFDVIKGWLPYHGVYEQPMFDLILEIGSVLLILAAVVFITRKLIKTKVESRSQLPLLNIFFIFSLAYLCAYLLFIAFTHSITIPQIDIIDRMLAPIIPLVVNIIVAALALMLNKKSKVPVIISLLAALLLVRFNFLTSMNFVNEMHTYGHGYSARQYQESGIIQQLQALPEDQRMVSNDAGFVLYYTNRFPLQVSQFANRTYGRKHSYGEESFGQGKSVLVLFFPEFRNVYGEETAETLLPTVINGLDILYEDEVGGIYAYPQESATQP